MLYKNNTISYSLNKIIMTLEQGKIFSSSISSGRDRIYMESFNIAKNNFYMPKGIGYYTSITQKNYPHNILLEILITFGICGLLCFIIGCVYLLIKFIKNYNLDDNYNYIIISMVIYSISRLMLSSSFWLESMFWMSIIMILYYPRNIRRKDF